MALEYLNVPFEELRAEVHTSSGTWVEGLRCPVKVGGLDCGGTLERKLVGGKIVLVCSEDEFYHSVTLHDA